MVAVLPALAAAAVMEATMVVMVVMVVNLVIGCNANWQWLCGADDRGGAARPST